jgi:hypothetical protein
VANSEFEEGIANDLVIPTLDVQPDLVRNHLRVTMGAMTIGINNHGTEVKSTAPDDLILRIEKIDIDGTHLKGGKTLQTGQITNALKKANLGVSLHRIKVGKIEWRHVEQLQTDKNFLRPKIFKLDGIDKSFTIK